MANFDVVLNFTCTYKLCWTLFWTRCLKIITCYAHARMPNDISRHCLVLWHFLKSVSTDQIQTFPNQQIFVGILAVIWRVRDILHVFTTYCIIISYNYDNNVVYLCKNCIYLMPCFHNIFLQTQNCFVLVNFFVKHNYKVIIKYFGLIKIHYYF